MDAELSVFHGGYLISTPDVYTHLFIHTRHGETFLNNMLQ